MPSDARRIEGESGQAVRAAWLHHAAGLTQAEVARRMGLSQLKVHRLVAKANNEGLVKIFVDGEISECVQLEERLIARYGLDQCRVVPSFERPGSEDAAMARKALGIAGAQFLHAEIGAGDRLIGMGNGRTLAACVEYLPRTRAGNTRVGNARFVSLLGGLTRKFAANPHDVIWRLAERTGAEAYVMPVPFLANSVEDRAVLFTQRGVREVFELGGTADLLMVGIGTVEAEASLVSSGVIGAEVMAEVRRAGAAGELLGHYFDPQGRPVATWLSERAFAPGRAQLARSRIVAVAGGALKLAAIRAVLATGLLSGLITDERTAAALAAPPDAAADRVHGAPDEIGTGGAARAAMLPQRGDPVPKGARSRARKGTAAARDAKGPGGTGSA